MGEVRIGPFEALLRAATRWGLSTHKPLDRCIVQGDTIGLFSQCPHNKWDVAASLVQTQCWLLAHCFFMVVVKLPLAMLALNIKFVTCTAVDELVVHGSRTLRP